MPFYLFPKTRSHHGTVSGSSVSGSVSVGSVAVGSVAGGSVAGGSVAGGSVAGEIGTASGSDTAFVAGGVVGVVVRSTGFSVSSAIFAV